MWPILRVRKNQIDCVCGISANAFGRKVVIYLIQQFT